MTLRDQLDSANRELDMRRRVYPTWVRAGRMTREKADHETAAMAAIVATLEKVIACEEIGLAWAVMNKEVKP